MVPMLLCHPKSRPCSEADSVTQMTCLIREARGSVMGTGALKEKQVRGREKAEREDMGEEKQRGKAKQRKRGRRWDRV